MTPHTSRRPTSCTAICTHIKYALQGKKVDLPSRKEDLPRRGEVDLFWGVEGRGHVYTHMPTYTSGGNFYTHAHIHIYI